MKNIKNLLVAALAVAAASSTQAAGIDTGNQKVYITGSTGFRATVNAALYSQYGSKLAVWDGGTSYSDKNLAAAKNLAFTNVALTGIGTVDIILSWGGSEAGVQCVASPTNNLKRFPFYDLGLISSATGATAKVSGGDMTKGSAGVSTYTTAQVATITFADNAQNASAFKGGSPSADGITYSTFGTTAGTGGQRFAVIPFNLYASKGFPVTDISTKAFYDLLQNGAIYGSQLSNDDPATMGNTNWTVHVVGRNVDSGTRVQAMLMSGYGTTKNVLQVSATTNATGIGTLTLEPAGTINGIGMADGNNGQSSGGTLAGWLTAAAADSTVTYVNITGTANLKKATNFLVSYIALPDATAQYANGIVPLTYNGVEGRCYSVSKFTNIAAGQPNELGAVSGAATFIKYLDQGYTNVITGRFPYWGYEYAYYNTNLASGAVAAQATTNIYAFLRDTITNYTSTDNFMYGAIKLSDMKVKRTTEGDRVIPGANLN